MFRPRLLLALLLTGAAALSFAQARAAGPAAAPPAAATAPPAAATAPPAAATAPATPTPTPGVSFDLSGIATTDVSGVWEVAHEEDTGRTSYTHFRIHQKGAALTGDWLAANGKAYPATGSVDGNTMKMEIRGPDGTIAVQAQLDPPANMVGLFVEPGGKRLVFTANNQAKYTPEPESSGGSEAGPPH
ncbi:hypothetical protein EPN42_13545 [bacterium]|nr:MAG: hypothetical protein EPN42_13545 [bacterium]